MSSIGIVAVDTSGKWIGGRYYLQHLVKAVKALPEQERVRRLIAEGPPSEQVGLEPFAPPEVMPAREIRR